MFRLCKGCISGEDPFGQVSKNESGPDRTREEHQQFTPYCGKTPDPMGGAPSTSETGDTQYYSKI
jgi:hypothetical protein